MFKALLATGRISNLPTVWSNVLVAFVIIFGVNPEHTGLLTVTHTLNMWLPLLITCLAASLLYVGGCFLGDAIDAKFDEQHKPDRPIPSGVLSRKGVFTGAIAMLALGSAIPFIITHGLIPADQRPESWLHLLAIPMLVAAIVLYSWLHKKSPWFGLPLIGACRFCLVLFGAAMAASCFYQDISFMPDSGWDPLKEMLNGILVTFAATVAAYTICFASVARSESSPKPISWRKVLIPTMLILPLWMLIPAMFESDFWEKLPQAAELLLHVETFPIILVALANYLIWNTCSFIKLKSNKGEFVSMSLAGFCLLDAFFIALSGWENFFIS